tara:strand:- start:202 stop:390 length:189 start_codon:yes stop_codon:yes gene_type:complete
MKNIHKNKMIAKEWFEELQNNICTEIELMENKNKKSKNLFSKKNGLEIRLVQISLEEVKCGY